MSASLPLINENALKILGKRYLWNREDGSQETPYDMWIRVAKVAASAERIWDPELEEVWRARFYEAMSHLRFIPNTPTLINAGREKGQMSACFVLPLADSMEGIMDALKTQALVQKSGGGTGFSFGCIRESGALIKSTQMSAVGPIPIIKLMNYMMSEFILQGGARHGANMAVLPVDHPNIVDFIKFKMEEGCKSFNVSVSVTDDFMRAVQDNVSVDLISRVDGAVVQTLPARDIFNMICEYAWKNGDPGLLFIDTINRTNPTPNVGRLEATNPCGEQGLLPNEACTLGHFNLSAYFISGKEDLPWTEQIDWAQMRADIDLGVRFLDDIIEVNYYPIKEIEDMHKNTNRKIGAGVMGLADLLILLGVEYDSPLAREISNAISTFLELNANNASMELAEVRGSFNAFKGSALDGKFPRMRNACRTTVAPTGTTAIIAGCSTGIEPIFSLILRRMQAGMEMFEVHPLFERVLNTLDNDTKHKVLDYYFEHNSVQECPDLDPEVSRLFLQANDVHPSDHINMQATWQKHIDNAISKTVNMDKSATIGNIRDAYMLAWKTGCKGVTVYRDGCMADQVLTTGRPKETTLTLIHDNECQLCKECGAQLEISGGCETCRSCGFAACSI